MNLTRAVLVSGVVLTWGSLAAMASEQIKFVVIESGNLSGISTRKVEVARSEKEWKELWSKHASRIMPPPPAPKVDFSRDMVIGAFAGTKSSGGYAVKIDALHAGSDEIGVDITMVTPPRGMPTASMMTTPFQMVRCPNRPGSLKPSWQE